MPIYGTERAIKGVAGLLKAHLGTTLNEIERETDGSPILPRPDWTFLENVNTGLADRFQLEIYENGTTIFPLGPHEGMHFTQALTSEVPIRVEMRVTNYDNLSPALMLDRVRRIGAAVLRVISRYAGNRTELDTYALESIAAAGITYGASTQIDGPLIVYVDLIAQIHEENDTTGVGGETDWSKPVISGRWINYA